MSDELFLVLINIALAACAGVLVIVAYLIAFTL